MSIATSQSEIPARACSPEGAQPRNSEDAWLAQELLFEWQHNTVLKNR